MTKISKKQLLGATEFLEFYKDHTYAETMTYFNISGTVLDKLIRKYGGSRNSSMSPPSKQEFEVDDLRRQGCDDVAEYKKIITKYKEPRKRASLKGG